jgi:hypothetical protein
LTADQFDVAASQRRWRESRPGESGIATGPPANRIIFENAQVRVWHLELPPGESTALHTHMHPYLFVVLQASRLLARFAGGSEVSVEQKEREAVWAGLDDATRTHVLTNVGDRVCVE